MPEYVGTVMHHCSSIPSLDIVCTNLFARISKHSLLERRAATHTRPLSMKLRGKDGLLSLKYPSVARRARACQSQVWKSDDFVVIFF